MEARPVRRGFPIHSTSTLTDRITCTSSMADTLSIGSTPLRFTGSHKLEQSHKHSLWPLRYLRVMLRRLWGYKAPAMRPMLQWPLFSGILWCGWIQKARPKLARTRLSISRYYNLGVSEFGLGL